jgi:ELP3 family radical SAM enzyme/protein acetyltransferase
MESNYRTTDIEDTLTESKPTIIDETKLKCCMKDLISLVNEYAVNHEITNSYIDKTLNQLKHKYKICPSKSQLRYVYEKHIDYFGSILNQVLERYLIKKSVRSRSGVYVATIVLRPDVFSCPKKCSYCPTETDLNGKPTQPKSYLSSETAMLRALRYNFDVRGQLCDRIKSYIKTGNIIESSGSKKMEIILSGGTWESYPYDYRNQVMTELYWAANTWNLPRPITTIENEIAINETAEYRIIGLTIETRPDFVTNQAIRDYCKWGVTRVQLGVQHYSDDILDGINRECHTVDLIKTLRKLKQCGFKVVCHLMPDLPKSSPELDKWMFDQALTNSDVFFDDVKIYPTAVCKSDNPNLLVKSDISDWYYDGSYVPYAETNLNKLIEVLKYYKTRVQPWVRIQRLVRDIPKQSILAGYEGISNLRQIIQNQMNKEGTTCKCIRCMEIGDNNTTINTPNLVVRQYTASGGQEYHISIESNEKSSVFSFDYWSWVWFLIIYYWIMIFYGRKTYWSGNLKTYNGLVGFCRFRIDENPGGGFIKELANCGLIREVHVYGHALGVGTSKNMSESSQHKGWGKLLVQTAEEIAVANGLTKVAIIAGVGAREYYKKKCGYQLEGTYMTKNLFV